VRRIKIWPDKFKLTNKVCVVTGGAGLIGQSIVKSLAQAEGKVILMDVNNEKGLGIAGSMQSSGLDVTYIYSDTSDIKATKAAMTKICDDLGGINVWINGAYPRTNDYGTMLDKVEIESWKNNIDMHLNSYCLLSRDVAELMKKNHGASIINIASIYGLVGPDFKLYRGTEMTMPAVYSAIKSGIIGFTKYLAAYYAQYNIRVNVIAPGGVFNNQPNIFIENYSKQCPLGRMADAEEIAAPVLFLASEASSYITGSVLVVDGGWTAI